MRQTRREFIKSLLASNAGIFALSLPPYSSMGSLITNAFAEDNSIPSSKIALSRDEALVKEGTKLCNHRLSMIIDNALMKISLAKSPEEAWGRLFRSDDIVGIKINALAGRPFSPHKALIEAIINGLKLAGVKEENIIIFDRFNKELINAGYEIKDAKNSLKCMGTDGLSDSGYDPQPQIIGSIGSCFSRIVSSYVTAIINVPVLKDHDLSGVSIGMKNFYGVIHNPNKYHDNNCDPYIADLNSHPYIRKKLRLIICDAIKAQYNGGPAFKPQWVWDYGGLIIGADPVALDLIGSRIIEEKRKEMGMPSLKEVGREPRYIQTAASIGLGFSDPQKIELIEI